MRVLYKILAAYLFLCGSAVASLGQEMTIDNFNSNPQNNWRFFADTVMGGVSSGKVEFKSEGGKAFAQMTGKVSTANNGGFIQIRRDLSVSPSADANGVRLMVRGNSQRYYIHLRTSGTLLPWQYYQAGFNVTPQWREVKLPLTSFKASGSMLRETPKATSLKSVAVVAFGKDYDADIQMREIGFY